MTWKLPHGNGQGTQECGTRKGKCDSEGGLEADHVLYASSTPGSTSDGNTLCSSEAPVGRTRPGFTPGAVLGRVASSLLRKADCPAKVLSAPPTVWKTVQHVS